jgi:hypothetical protein
MTKLHADLEALMPEPLALVAQFCGTWRESESVYAEPVFSANQVREAMQAVNERAAKLAATLAYDAAIKYANGREVDFEQEVGDAIRGTGGGA